MKILGPCVRFGPGACIAACVFALLAGVPPAGAQPFRNLMGVEIDSSTEGARNRAFVDLGRVFRPFRRTDSAAQVPADEQGWPLTDGAALIFDIRPVPEWTGTIDDPAAFKPDWSGVYSIGFKGQAILTASPGVALAGQSYDPETNRTTLTADVAGGTALFLLTFTGTRRAPEDLPGTGITDLRVIRPGYAADSMQVFTEEFLHSLRPFRVLRFMDFTETNNTNPAFSDAANQLDWDLDRHTVGDATQQRRGRKAGVAWEYAIQLANQTGKDAWINIPVAASDGYVRALAELFQARLNPALTVYVEHSNEVWNPGFTQCAYNREAAAAEVAAGDSSLANDGNSSLDEWARRRHARRVIEIVRIFRGALGGDRVRGIYSWWTANSQQYRTTLNWVRATFGEPNQFFHALGTTHYYSARNPAVGTSPEGVLTILRNSSDSGAVRDRQLREIAGDFSLRHVIYEGGSDVGGGGTTNVGNRILANRLPEMKDLVIRDMRDNWFAQGGGLYVYFSHCGPCSRNGCWGAAEDIARLDTPKFRALIELAGELPAPEVSSVQSGTITGANLAEHAANWDEAVLPGRADVPTMLAGAAVRINGRPAALLSVSPTRIEFIPPAPATEGDVEVEVIAYGGVWREVRQIEAK